MRRIVTVILVGVLLTGIGWTGGHVSAAGRQDSSTKPPKLQKGVTLSVWNYFNDAEVAAQKDVFTAFTKKYGIKIGDVENPTNAQNKFLLNAPTGNAPDLIGIPHNVVGSLLAGKVLAPVPAWAWSPADQKKYIPAAVKATTFNGHEYAMPWAIETTGLFYNKALISPSAFKPAKGDKYLRWSTILPKLQKLTDLGSKKFGFVMDMNNFYYDYAFLSAYGGYVFKYQKGKGYNWKNLGLDTPAAVNAIKLYASLSTEGGKYKLVTPSTSTNTADGLFEAGQAAVEWSGPWNEGNFAAKNINFGFAPLPSIDGKHPSHPFSTIQVYAVNKYSKHLNEAFALLKYMTQNMEIPAFKAAGRIPVLKSGLNSKTVQGNAVAKQLGAAALHADPIPNIAEMDQVWTPAATDWNQVALGKATAAQAAKQAQKDVLAAIAKSHGG